MVGAASGPPTAVGTIESNTVASATSLNPLCYTFDMGLEWWQLWLLLGIVLFIAEIFTPGFLLACLGISCLAAFLPAAFGLGLEWQLGSFVVSFIIVLLTLRPWFLRHFKQAKEARPTNIDALVGKVGKVTSGSSDRGGARVQAGGDNWAVVCQDGQDIEAGSEVEIVDIDGVKLVVKQKKPKREWF